MIKHLRIIGDVHGRHDRYHQLIRKARYTIQIGDFGFDYDTLLNVDPTSHKFFGGNHDNYDEIEDSPNNLGDFGIHNVPDFGMIFFVRGGYSRDAWCRTVGVSIWPEEELSMDQCGRALDLYRKTKPSFVITHEAPIDIVKQIVKPEKADKTKTNQLLQAMLDFHAPQQWIFGHYHVSWRKVIEKTLFVCLEELECLDFDKRVK